MGRKFERKYKPRAAKQIALARADRATALYMRVSTQTQVDEGYGLEAQRQKLLAFCTAQGWQVDARHVYIDAAESGAKLERPALQRLLADVRAGEIERVVIYKLDRLARSVKHFVNLWEDELEAYGCAIVSATEQLDTSTPTGRLLVQMLAAFAELERVAIGERLRYGKGEAARTGSSLCGRPAPFGYEYNEDTGRLEVQRTEARIVARLFEEFNAGAGLRSLADKLNGAGVASPKGGKWHAQTVRRVLGNGTYAGLVQWAEHEVAAPKVAPAIVSQPVYEAACARVQALKPGNPTWQ